MALPTADQACSDDPRLIVTRALASGADDPHESVLMAWLLSLPDALDPALAARRVLSRVAEDRPGPDRRPLLELLEETARWRRDRLERFGRRPGRASRGRA